MRPAPARLRLQLLPLAALLAAGCGSGDATKSTPSAAAPPTEPLSVLLVTLDTTRADALSCYSADGPYSGTFRAPEDATPVLDALAARGVRYTAASTVAPLTLPAHASMLTGRIPPSHGIRENGLWGLPDEVQTVTELARAEGVRTGAFLAAVVLDSTYGLDQGFEVYDAPTPSDSETSTHYVERPANEVVDSTLAWLGTLERDERTFTWVHLFDPHQPYAPPAAFRSTGTSGDATHAAYQGEIAFADQQVGRLLRWLDDTGRADDTLVLVVADHGESLGEHGEWSHAAFVFEATLRVPFLIAYPNGYRAGDVSDELLSVVDVAPTVREALGLSGASDSYQDGLSLFGRRVPADRRTYFESFSGHLSFGWSPIVGEREGRWKVLQSADPQVFDLRADADEAANRAEAEAARLDAARGRLAAVLTRAAARAPRETAIDGVRGEELAALGYTAAGAGIGTLPDPLRPGDLPAPHLRAQEYQDTLRASALANEGRWEEAQRLAHSVVRTNAGNVVALQTWTSSLVSLERHAEAVPGLRRLVAKRPATAGFHYNLGVALSRSGAVDEGVGALWRAVELDLDNEPFLAELQRVLREHGRRQEFEDYGRRWQALRSARDARAPGAR